jgi:hypothetical protein
MEETAAQAAEEGQDGGEAGENDAAGDLSEAVLDQLVAGSDEEDEDDGEAVGNAGEEEEQSSDNEVELKLPKKKARAAPASVSASAPAKPSKRARDEKAAEEKSGPGFAWDAEEENGEVDSKQAEGEENALEVKGEGASRASKKSKRAREEAAVAAAEEALASEVGLGCLLRCLSSSPPGLSFATHSLELRPDPRPARLKTLSVCFVNSPTPLCFGSNTPPICLARDR